MSQRLEQRQAPERLVIERLTLRRPRTTDAAAILQCYAGDPDVTRSLARPRHRSTEDTGPSWSGAIRCGAACPQGPT